MSPLVTSVDGELHENKWVSEGCVALARNKVKQAVWSNPAAYKVSTTLHCFDPDKASVSLQDCVECLNDPTLHVVTCGHFGACIEIPKLPLASGPRYPPLDQCGSIGSRQEFFD